MHAAELLGARCSRRLLPNLLNRRRNQQYSLLLIQSLSAGGLRHSSFSSHTEQQLKQPCTQDVRAADECGEVLLTRDFIARSLYNRDNGYFSTKDVINHLPGALDFRSMLGEWHYRLAVKQAYESKLSAWMTPVEIFSPHFSHALARYISREALKTANAQSTVASADMSKRNRHSRTGREHNTPRRKTSSAGDHGYNKTRLGNRGDMRDIGGEGLVVYEVGGGSGTNALNVLDWLQREEPELYDRTEYTIVEISERLAALQRERVCAVHTNCRVVNADVLEWGISGDVDSRPCFFLGMEVMDNLPHDKIAWANPAYSFSPQTNHQADPDGFSQDSAFPNRLDKSTHVGYHDTAIGSSPRHSQGRQRDELVGVKFERKEVVERASGDGGKELCEAVVVKRKGGGYREAFRPLRDPVIRELLEIFPDLEKMVEPRQQSSSFSSEVPTSSFSSVTSSALGAVRDIFGRVDGGNNNLQPEFQAAFVPTGMLKMFHALRRKLPRHRLIIADFDAFPAAASSTAASSMPFSTRGSVNVSLDRSISRGQGTGEATGAGSGFDAMAETTMNASGGGDDGEELLAFQAPIVSSRDPVSGIVEDHDAYTVPLGSADIFFPTCFQRLSRLHAEVCGDGCSVGAGGRGGVKGLRRRPGTVMKQGAFLNEYGDVAATRTLTGYNPMVEDFVNASVFLSGIVVDDTHAQE